VNGIHTGADPGMKGSGMPLKDVPKLDASANIVAFACPGSGGPGHKRSFRFEGEDVPRAAAGKVLKGAGIDYRIRTSLRARNLRLLLSPRDGLTVVAPLGYDLRRIPAIVEKKRSWIETHLRRFVDAASRAAERRPAAIVLPETLELPALGESWRIEYRPTNTRVVGVLAEEPGRITVYGAVSDHDACIEALKGWLRRRTREELVPWLGRLAGQNGFKFKEALIRGQKTRWASCSTKGTINLSFKLLFLERDWVRCVLVHELCHTVLMNHSPRFWALLEGLEPECRAIQKKMRDGWRRVPVWLEERGGE
jgi:predicted metal-dependent hydrolase